MRRITIALCVIILIAILHFAFPYALDDESTRLQALYLSLLLILMLGGRRMLRRPVSRTVRDAAIWLALILALVMAYSFRDEFRHSRLMAELIPSQVQVNGDGTLSVRASAGGHFMVEAQVNGARVRFMIDTGASDIVLAPADARRAGLDPDSLDYTRLYTTANGDGKGASVSLNSLVVGNIALSHVSASVNRLWMQNSLLGMSFLSRLKGFRVEGNRLLLMP